MSEQESVRCLNCGATFQGVYCPSCAQKASTRRLRLADILGEVTSQLFNLDAKVPRTVLALTRNPGRVCREYVEGKRERYVPPFRYCLTIVALVLLGYALFGVDVAQIAEHVSGPATGATREVQHTITSFVAQHLNLVIFAALPVFALIVRWLFYASGYNYAEVGAFVLYVMGHVLLLALLLTPLRGVAAGPYLALRILLQLGLFTWAALVFFEPPLLAGILKSLLATGLYFLVVAGVVMVILLPRILHLVRGG